MFQPVTNDTIFLKARSMARKGLRELEIFKSGKVSLLPSKPGEIRE